MVRKKATFTSSIEDIQQFKVKVLHFLEKYNTFTFLDNNGYQILPYNYEFLAAAGVSRSVHFSEINQSKDWLFFQFDYEFEPLNPQEKKYQIYVPEVVIYQRASQTEICIECLGNPDEIFAAICQEANSYPINTIKAKPFATSISKEQYIKTIEQIRADIFLGKYYELNYCIDFQTRASIPLPNAFFHQLNQSNPAPMAAFCRQDKQYLFCNSPERFLCRQDDDIIAQPIKGTAPKGGDVGALADKKAKLKASVKDRAENVMIVDLTRNDLSKICKTASVQVPELFGIYAFTHVLQMISTVQGRLQAGTGFTDIWSATFPMGSMTGAPKTTVMAHIQSYEHFVRGRYSGSIGYIDPRGNFDANVVIRSLEYNAVTGLVEYKAGGAITYQSTAEQEWEEIIWKSKSMANAFDIAD